jgi:hypothetical protein
LSYRFEEGRYLRAPFYLRPGSRSRFRVTVLQLDIADRPIRQ